LTGKGGSINRKGVERQKEWRETQNMDGEEEGWGGEPVEHKPKVSKEREGRNGWHLKKKGIVNGLTFKRGK